MNLELFTKRVRGGQKEYGNSPPPHRTIDRSGFKQKGSGWAKRIWELPPKKKEEKKKKKKTLTEL